MNLIKIVEKAWAAVATNDFDTLVNDFVEDMAFIMPGQNDVIEGKQAFRMALDSFNEEKLPPGFEITGLRHLQGENEVVSIVEWRSNKISSSQLSILFKFNGNKMYEERWFVDTEQWKNAF